MASYNKAKTRQSTPSSGNKISAGNQSTPIFIEHEIIGDASILSWGQSPASLWGGMCTWKLANCTWQFIFHGGVKRWVCEAAAPYLHCSVAQVWQAGWYLWYKPVGEAFLAGITSHCQGLQVMTKTSDGENPWLPLQLPPWWQAHRKAFNIGGR